MLLFQLFFTQYTYILHFKSFPFQWNCLAIGIDTCGCTWGKPHWSSSMRSIPWGLAAMRSRQAWLRLKGCCCHLICSRMYSSYTRHTGFLSMKFFSLQLKHCCVHCSSWDLMASWVYGSFFWNESLYKKGCLYNYYSTLLLTVFSSVFTQKRKRSPVQLFMWTHILVFCWPKDDETLVKTMLNLIEKFLTAESSVYTGNS